MHTKNIISGSCVKYGRQTLRPETRIFFIDEWNINRYFINRKLFLITFSAHKQHL